MHSGTKATFVLLLLLSGLGLASGQDLDFSRIDFGGTTRTCAEPGPVSG